MRTIDDAANDLTSELIPASGETIITTARTEDATEVPILTMLPPIETSGLIITRVVGVTETGENSVIREFRTSYRYSTASGLSILDGVTLYSFSDGTGSTSSVLIKIDGLEIITIWLSVQGVASPMIWTVETTFLYSTFTYIAP
jgi:hypothetical protein